jgi:hypothetical protein
LDCACHHGGNYDHDTEWERLHDFEQVVGASASQIIAVNVDGRAVWTGHVCRLVIEIITVNLNGRTSSNDHVNSMAIGILTGDGC